MQDFCSRDLINFRKYPVVQVVLFWRPDGSFLSVYRWLRRTFRWARQVVHDVRASSRFAVRCLIKPPCLLLCVTPGQWRQKETRVGDSLFNLLNNFTHSENLNTALETVKWEMGGARGRVKGQIITSQKKGFKKQSCMWVVEGGGGGCQSVAWGVFF